MASLIGVSQAKCSWRWGRLGSWAPQTQRIGKGRRAQKSDCRQNLSASSLLVNPATPRETHTHTHTHTYTHTRTHARTHSLHSLSVCLSLSTPGKNVCSSKERGFEQPAGWKQPRSQDPRDICSLWFADLTQRTSSLAGHFWKISISMKGQNWQDSRERG